MCVMEKRTYVYASGQECTVEVPRLCSRHSGSQPCANLHHEFVRVDVEDPGSPSYSMASPASLSHPATPIQVREVRPTVVVDGRSTSDGEPKKRRTQRPTSFNAQIHVQLGSSKSKGQDREKRYNRRSADSTVTSGSDYSTYHHEPRSRRESLLASSPLSSRSRSAHTGTAYQTQTPPPPPPPPRKPPVGAASPDSPPLGPRRKVKKAVIHHGEDVAREILPRADAREQSRNEERTRWETERITRENIKREADDARRERDRPNYREDQRQAARLAREKQEKRQREDEARRSQKESDARAAERASFRAKEQEAPRTTRTRRGSIRTRRPSLRPEDRPAVQELRANMEAERAQQEQNERLEALQQQNFNPREQDHVNYNPRHGAPFNQLRHEHRNSPAYYSPVQAHIREVVPGPSDLHERGQQVLEQARNASRALHDQMDDLTVEDDVFNETQVPGRGGLHRRNTSGGGGASGGHRRKPYFR